MIYGYARVSTVAQAKDGNSLEAQAQVLRENGATELFFDSYTGTKEHRPEFDKLLDKLTKGDILLVTKIDRLTRNLSQGLEIIDKLVSKSVTVNVLNMGVMNNTPTGKLMVQVFMAFAEFERNMIVERTQEGRRIARTKPDYQDGRPAREIKNLEETYHKVKQKELSLDQALELLNIPRSTWFYRVKQLKA